MNCFTHSLPFLDRPEFMVGCCVPDWLGAVDRKCRVREKRAAEFVDDPDPFVAEVARGVVQHHQDDHWFHQTRAFTELNLEFSQELREVLQDTAGHRASLLGHVLVELLLDACLIEKNPGKLDCYYRQVESVNSVALQNAINRFAAKSTDQLTVYIDDYLQSRFLFDYLEDNTLTDRLNSILARVKLPALANELNSWLPTARRRVYDQCNWLVASHLEWNTQSATESNVTDAR